MESISDILENESCITVNWLANHFQTDLFQAEDLLIKFNAQNPIELNYLLSGQDQKGGLLFIVVNEKDVEMAKSSMSKCFSQKLFSVQKSQSEFSKTLALESTLKQAEKLFLETTAIEGSFLTNNTSSLYLKNLQVKPVGQWICSSHNINAIHNTQSVQKPIPAVPAASTAPPSKVMATSTKNEPSTNTKITKVATSFFAKKDSSEPKKETISSKIDTPSPEPISFPVENKRSLMNNQDLDDEDAEWEDSSNIGTKRTKLTILKSSPVKQEDSNPMVEFISQSSEENNEPEQVSKKAKSSKNNCHVRGAMDDFFEDAAIEEYKKQQLAPQNPTITKKTKKVLVEKVFADAKGYLVTEMVYEEVTDNEEEPTETTTSLNKENKENKEAVKPKSEKSAPVKSTAKKDTKALSGSQKSMMSFFTKKA